MYSRMISLMLFVTLLVVCPSLSRGKLQEGQDLKVLETKAPSYPAIALAAHARGTVLVNIEIDRDGQVATASTVSGPPLLLAASKKAALGWRLDSSEAGADIRLLLLTFDFVPEASCNQVVTVTPYHLRITPAPPPDTVSYLPSDSEKTYCKVHKTRLVRDKVEIIYGLVEVGSPTDYETAEKTLFPNANQEAFGGCGVEELYCDGVKTQLSPKYAEVLYCSKCRYAQAEWIRMHKRRQANSN